MVTMLLPIAGVSNAIGTEPVSGGVQKGSGRRALSSSVQRRKLLVRSRTSRAGATLIGMPMVRVASYPTYSLCCIVDEHPRFYVEFVLWVLCSSRYLPVGRFCRVAYTIGSVPDDLTNWAASRGVQIKRTSAIIEGSPHVNKIAPFFDEHDTDFTIVCDTDLFFVDDPSVILRTDRFRAAPNNHCNPPSHILRAILDASGLGRPYRPGIALFRAAGGQRETHINNISAGIVVAPRFRCYGLAAKWKKWARWLVDNHHLLDVWGVHVDQVAFMLAVEELGEDVEFLPPQANTILHLFEEISECFAVHLTTGHIPSFPQRFNIDRTLRTDGLTESMADRLHRLNLCIEEAACVIHEVSSTCAHWDKFLNPSWHR